MRTITMTVQIQFDADQVTDGDTKTQAEQAIEIINGSMQREPYGMGAQILPASLREVTEEGVPGLEDEEDPEGSEC